MTAKANQLVYEFENSTNTSTQPALVVGSATGAIAGALSLVALFINIPEGVTQAILVIAAFLLPLITALFTKNKVWSPASVQQLVEEAVRRALDASGKSEPKFNPPLDKTPDPGGSVTDF
jgi:hypothetical protein